jgi:hypothetical protein
MKIKHNKGDKLVSLILTERLYETKLKNISQARKSKGAPIETLIRKKPKDVMIIYKWGKSKESLYEIEDPDTGESIEKSIPKYYFTSELFSSISDKKLTKKNLIDITQENLMLNYDAFQRQIADTSNIHPLREIVFKFIY